MNTPSNNIKIRNAYPSGAGRFTVFFEMAEHTFWYCLDEADVAGKPLEAVLVPLVLKANPDLAEKVFGGIKRVKR